MDISEISPLAVALAALSMFVIGGAWYGGLVARPWQRATGLTEEQLGNGSARVFSGSAALSVIIAASMAAFIGSSSVVAGLAVGLVAGATFAAAPLWIIALFERRPLALALVDGGYVILAFAAMGTIIGALQ